MIHNGIEYAMMQGYAEGFELMSESYYGLDLPKIAELWNHGSVVRSWLLELAADALAADPKLDSLQPFVEDSGEGRWTVRTPSRRRCRRRPSPPRCSRASGRDARTPSPTACSPRSATRSAATRPPTGRGPAGRVAP
jgi:hypothetical protein